MCEKRAGQKKRKVDPPVAADEARRKLVIGQLIDDFYPPLFYATRAVISTAINGKCLT